MLVLALSVLASMAVYLLLYGLHGEEADAGTWLCCILSLISGVIVVRLVFLAQEQPKQQGDQCNEVNQCKDEQFSCKRLLWLLYTVPVASGGVRKTVKQERRDRESHAFSLWVQLLSRRKGCSPLFGTK